MNELSSEYPETSFDDLSGDVSFFAIGSAGGASSEGGGGAASEGGVGAAGAPAPPPVDVSTAGLDEAWRRVVAPAPPLAPCLPGASATASGRWVSARAPSAEALFSPLTFSRTIALRREYLRQWWVDPRGYTWLPYGCAAPRLPSARDARACLAGRRVLFAGDSHDRGLFSHILALLWGADWASALPPSFAGTRCVSPPGELDADAATGGAAGGMPSPQPMVTAPLSSLKNESSLTEPLPPQVR